MRFSEAVEEAATRSVAVAHGDLAAEGPGVEALIRQAIRVDAALVGELQAGLEAELLRQEVGVLALRV